MVRGCVRPFLPQVLVDSEVLLLLAPHLSAALQLTTLYMPGADDHMWRELSAGEKLQTQQRAADLVGRLAAQLVRCSDLKQLSVKGLPARQSLELATSELVLAPQLQRLTVTTEHLREDVTSRPAAVAALAAALTTWHYSRPDVAASRALHMTTNLVSQQGAEEVMRVLGGVGVQGVRVVYVKSRY